MSGTSFDEVIAKIEKEDNDASNFQTNENPSHIHNEEQHNLHPNQNRIDLSNMSNRGKAIRTETEEKPYQCETCLKRFADHWHLQTHTFSHTGEKPHNCEICGIVFTDSNNLKKHRRKHIGEKPFEYHVFGKTFTQSSNLNKHARVHTDNQVSFKENETISTENKAQEILKILTNSHEAPVRGSNTNQLQFNPNLQNPLTRNFQPVVRIEPIEKPHQCETYLKRFVDCSHLQRHIRTHAG